MATVDATIKAIQLAAEPYHGGNNYEAKVMVTFGAYTSSSDTAKIGGNATAQLWGAASDSLATLIQKCRRDGKTVTIRNAMRGEPGSQGGTAAYFGGAVTVTSGNLTANLTNLAGTDTTFSSGVSDAPIEVNVSYSLA